jgi:hypothetical protein
VRVIIVRDVEEEEEKEEKSAEKIKTESKKEKKEAKPAGKVKKEPGVRQGSKKRSFSVALQEPKMEPLEVKEINDKEEDFEDFGLPTPEALLAGEEDGIAHRTRRRRALQSPS